jgi:polyferredoxin
MLSLWCGLAAPWTGWELFGAFAWRAVPPLVGALAVGAVAVSAFVPRAYCRFACPTGTLLKIAESRE